MEEKKDMKDTENFETNNNIKTNPNEIDLVEIIQKLWKSRVFIFRVTLVFILFGLIVAISSPSVYTASCTMVPQTGEKKVGGSLSGLAAMAGINVGSLSSGEVLAPSVYPKIISNVNFQKELIYSKFHFQGIEKPVSLYEYYTENKSSKFNLLGFIKKYTIGLPELLTQIFRGKQTKDNILASKGNINNVQYLTGKEKSVIDIVTQNISLTINDKQGILILSTNMPEAFVAAELVQTIQELLQKYITEFKVEKVSNNLRFVEKSYEEARKKFEEKQEELARYRDANKSVSSAMARTHEDKLASEYNLLLSVYTELAKQREQAKIAVTETTPILTIIEPAVVPNERSKPKRKMILILYTFIGIVIGSGWIVVMTPILELFKSNNDKSAL